MRRTRSISEGSEDFIVFCDASHHGVDALLMQRNKVIDNSRRMVILNISSLREDCCISKVSWSDIIYTKFLTIFSEVRFDVY